MEKAGGYVNELVQGGAHVVVLGDLNEGPAVADTQAPKLTMLFENNSPLIDCYSLPGFDLGNRPGTFNSCVLRNRFDYIFISKSLQPYYRSGRVFERDRGAAAQNVLLSGRHIPR